MESASQKNISNVMSFQLHVDTSIKYILNHFPLLEIMTIESICIRVKDLDLYIIETTCKLIKVTVTFLYKYEDFLFIRTICLYHAFLAVSMLFVFALPLV